MKIFSCSILASEAITGAGLSLDDLVSLTKENRFCISDPMPFDPEDGPGQLSCEVPYFALADFNVSTRGYLDRHSEIALATAASLFRKAGETREDAMPGDGLAIGTAWGNTEAAETFWNIFLEKSPHSVSPMVFQHVYPNTTASLLAIEFGLAGTHACFNSDVFASAQAILHAIMAVNDGRATRMLAGGAETMNETVGRHLDPEGFLPNDEDASAPQLLEGEGATFLWLGADAPSSARIFGVYDRDVNHAAQSLLREARMDVKVLAWVLVDKPEVIAEEASRVLFPLPAERVIDLRTIIGETFGARAAIACAAAWGCLESDERPRGALVITGDGNAGLFAFLIAKR